MTSYCSSFRIFQLIPCLCLAGSTLVVDAFQMNPKARHYHQPNQRGGSQNRRRISLQQSASTTDAFVTSTSQSSSITNTIPIDDEDDNDLMMMEMSGDSTTIVVEATNSEESSTAIIPLWKLALAGGIATLVSDVSMHPIDCIKTLQQSDIGLTLNFWQAAEQIWDDSGISGFYHGLWTYALSDALGGSIKFASFERCQQFVSQKLVPQKKQPPSALTSSLIVLTSAAMAFVCSSIVTVPGEFFKQQLQMSYYDTLWQAICHTYNGCGPSGFYAGYDGLLLRDIPYTMLELGLYTFFTQQFQKKEQQQQHSNSENENDEVETTTTTTTTTMQQQIMAAALTGGIAGLLTTPLDTIKTKLMVDETFHGAGFYDCFFSTVHHHGWESLFAGGLARVAWLVPLTVLYLPTYDFLKQKLHPTSSSR